MAKSRSTTPDMITSNASRSPWAARSTSARSTAVPSSGAAVVAALTPYCLSGGAKGSMRGGAARRVRARRAVDRRRRTARRSGASYGEGVADGEDGPRSVNLTVDRNPLRSSRIRDRTLRAKTYDPVIDEDVGVGRLAVVALGGCRLSVEPRLVPVDHDRLPRLGRPAGSIGGRSKPAAAIHSSWVIPAGTSAAKPTIATTSSGEPTVNQSVAVSRSVSVWSSDQSTCGRIELVVGRT